MPCSNSSKSERGSSLPASFSFSFSFSPSSENAGTALASCFFAQTVQDDYTTDFHRSSQPASTKGKPNFDLNNNRSQGNSQGHNQGQQQHNCNHKRNTKPKWTLLLKYSINGLGCTCATTNTANKIPEQTPSNDSNQIHFRMKDRAIAAEMDTWGSSALVVHWSASRKALGWYNASKDWGNTRQKVARRWKGTFRRDGE